MVSYIIIFFIFIASIFYSKSYFKQLFIFLKTRSIITGLTVALLLFTSFCYLFLMFSPINLPYINLHPILFRLALIPLVIQTLTTTLFMNAVFNPQNEIIQSLTKTLKKEEEKQKLIEESNKIINEVKQWTKKYEYIVNEYNQKLKEIENNPNLSIEDKNELSEKVKKEYQEKINKDMDNN